MKKFLVFVLTILFLKLTVLACTNFLVSKGASIDGTPMITYAADAHVLYGELYYTAAAVYPEGAMLDIYEWDTGKYLGKIPQVRKTYAVVGNMNEHQVAIGETTYGGRKELRNKDGIMDYGSLIYVTLQRAKTARQAIEIMNDLVQTYGYYSSGESFSIADKNEVWIMDLIGKGKDEKGAVWVARRVPDGYVSGHANQARIRQFPLKDKKKETLYSPDVISFARKMGYFKGEDKNFSFVDAYAPIDYGALRFCEIRVWAMFNRILPKDQRINSDYIDGVAGAKPMPLWVKPARKLGVKDLMELMRDHLQGTKFDMEKGVGAGPYKLPYRWRPLTWEVEGQKGVKYCNERATSTQQTGFSFVSQSGRRLNDKRNTLLPDPIGGILWFGLDDTNSTVYTPMYCGIRSVPKSFAVGTGSFNEFTWESAFWVFNFVSNYAYSRYSDMIQDIKKVQGELEGNYIAMTKEIDQAAYSLYKKSPELAREYLTKYSVETGDALTKRWKKLGEFLIFKYLDGNMKDENNKVTHPGYPKAWYKRITEESGDFFKMKKLPGKKGSH